LSLNFCPRLYEIWPKKSNLATLTHSVNMCLVLITVPKYSINVNYSISPVVLLFLIFITLAVIVYNSVLFMFLRFATASYLIL